MPGPLTDLTVAARFAWRTLGRRFQGDVDAAPDPAPFRRAMTDALTRLPDGLVASHAWITLPATEPPWRDSGLVLAPGQSATWLAVGRVYASRTLDIWVRPRNQIWARVGETGEVVSSSRDSRTISAPGGGALSFGNYFPNDWAKPDGTRLQDDAVYRTVSGETTILAIVWAGDPATGLEALRREADPDGLVSGEIERLAHGTGQPEGWHYLWHLGESEAFRPASDEAGGPAIECRVHGDVGILQHDVDLPLEDDTTLDWCWRVDALPGLLREDTLPSHDYLSIAVEFDSGRDITYYWSRALPVGTGYDCPLPNWKGKEYHVVVRSGLHGLGEWHREERHLRADHAHYMGPPPTRVTRVWLIANSIFMRQLGHARFADIRLRTGDREVKVLAA